MKEILFNAQQRCRPEWSPKNPCTPEQVLTLPKLTLGPASVTNMGSPKLGYIADFVIQQASIEGLLHEWH